jgi:hypothetical protein
MNVPPDRYDEIARQISSDASPVGIDAKKTHVMILHLLERIEQRLEATEQRLARIEDRLAEGGEA